MVSRRDFLKYLGLSFLGGAFANLSEGCFFPVKELTELEKRLGNISIEGKKLVAPPFQITLSNQENYSSAIINVITSNNSSKKNSKFVFENKLKMKKYAENRLPWVTIHSYFIEDLDMDKIYPYHLSNSRLKGCIRTAPKNEFNFSVVGDTQEWRTKKHDRYMKQRVVREMLKKDITMVLNCGDVTNDGGVDDWLFRFLPAYWDLLTKTMSSYVKGNHDYRSTGFDSMHSWKSNKILSHKGFNYSFQLGNVSFFILDSNLGKKSHARSFLEKKLDESKTKFNLAFFHHPFDIETKDLPLNAVFCGHYHNYRRFEHKYQKIPYIITGGGGGTLVEPDTEWPANLDDLNVISQGKFNHHVYLSVKPDQINAKVIDINGKIRDRFFIY